MKSRLLSLISMVLVVLFASTFLNGCGVAMPMAVISDHSEICKIQDVMIKTQRGITFDYYCSNQSERSTDFTGTVKCSPLVKVKYIQPGSDAAKAEIQVGDQITLVNGIGFDTGTAEYTIINI